MPPDEVLVSSEFGYFLEVLNLIRGDTPLVVSSWYRSPQHPIEAAKPHPGSHATGLAVDMSMRGDRAMEAMRIAHSRLPRNWMGIGVSQKGDTRFLHLDCAGSPMAKEVLGERHPARPMCWSY